MKMSNLKFATDEMNIIDFKEFYKTLLGSVLQAEITAIIQKIWPNFNDPLIEKNQRICLSACAIGFGYTTPYLTNIAKHIAFYPGTMGGSSWPDGVESRSVLVDPELLPLPDRCLDKLLVVHALEHCSNPKIFLTECYRVLAPEGKLLIIAPNRRSLWAHLDCSPLGHGQPYTMTQLSKRLNEASFSPKQSLRGLYTPPHNSDFFISFCKLFETIGPLVAPKFSGIIAIEAEKSTNEIKSGIVETVKLMKPRKKMLNTGNARVFINSVT
jgi:ubiquinone/menaquinone biosynthesis C-methylase UbiE